MKIKTAGFTLIEVVIVVAIVGILAAIAIPSYQNSVQKSRRAEAKDALMNVAARQERWFLQHNQYVASGAPTDTLDIIGAGVTDNGFYDVTISNPCGDSSCYTVTATALAAQLNDTVCERMTINHIGVKESFKKGVPNSNPRGTCW